MDETIGPERAERIAEQWRRERPDIDPSPMVPLGHLSQAAQLLSERLGAVFRRHGLGRGGFDVLASLRRAGAPYALTPTALWSQLMLTSGTMTSRLDRLEKNGFITREPSLQDRRAVIVRLTQKGLATVDAAVVDHVANERRILSVFSPQEVEQLSQLLARLIVSLGTTEEEEGGCGDKTRNGDSAAKSI